MIALIDFGLALGSLFLYSFIGILLYHISMAMRPDPNCHDLGKHRPRYNETNHAWCSCRVFCVPLGFFWPVLLPVLAMVLVVRALIKGQWMLGTAVASQITRPFEHHDPELTKKTTREIEEDLGIKYD